jgi:hypothetical protein
MLVEALFGMLERRIRSKRGLLATA